MNTESGILIVMLSAVMPSVILLNVVAPKIKLECYIFGKAKSQS
jgi:hypothetical protein